MKKVQTKQKLNYQQAFKTIWQYLRLYHKQTVFVIISAILIALFNGAIIIGQYFFQKYLIDLINNGSDQQSTIAGFAAILFSTIIVVLALFIIQSIVMTKVAQHVGKTIRSDLYTKLLELKLAYFDQNPSGDIMAKLTNDVNNITNALSQNVTQFMINATQITIMLIAMFIFSPILATVALLLTPVQIFVVFILFKKAQPNFAKKQQALGDLNGFIEETISGQIVINHFNQQQATLRAFQTKSNYIQKLDQQSLTLASLVNPWNTFMQWLVRLLVLVLATVFALNNINFGGVVNTVVAGKSDPAIIISLLSALLLLISNYSNPIYQIFQMLNLLQAAIAGVESAFVIKAQALEINENERIEIQTVKSKIEFKNLTFSYDGGKTNVLKNLNLTVAPGQVVGIVGPTGSGKTTIINLLTKFYDIDQPESDIFIDGVSLKTISKSAIRDQISLVLQEAFVFGTTINENLRIVKPDATRSEIEQACKMANIDFHIQNLTNGYETVLNDNATNFSQGQKQLLAIARAFLKPANILILDEATSNIDSKTEKDIQSAMLKLSQGKTTFMIAHRLSTIKHADIIIVLKDGQIIEQGNHQELLDLNGFYATMYQAKLNTPEDL